jgi:hypothetical protein
MLSARSGKSKYSQQNTRRDDTAFGLKAWGLQSLEVSASRLFTIAVD